MSGPFDVIVVGSGFGGAVVACRLAEAGARVLVLERGRRWTREHYPRQPGDPWLYSHTRPDKHNGWLDLRFSAAWPSLRAPVSAAARFVTPASSWRPAQSAGSRVGRRS